MRIKKDGIGDVRATSYLLITENSLKGNWESILKKNIKIKDLNLKEPNRRNIRKEIKLFPRIANYLYFDTYKQIKKGDKIISICEVKDWKHLLKHKNTWLYSEFRNYIYWEYLTALENRDNKEDQLFESINLMREFNLQGEKFTSFIEEQTELFIKELIFNFDNRKKVTLTYLEVVNEKEGIESLDLIKLINSNFDKITTDDRDRLEYFKFKND